MLMTYRELDCQQWAVEVGSHQMPWLSPSALYHLAAGTCDQATAIAGIKQYWAFSLSWGGGLAHSFWSETSP